jgi:tetratricopeptide (TPR) repeat protein
MAFEKGKVLKAAEKFLSQGNINAAIKEYRQIVEHDQSDFTTLNMLGDLCVRAGKKEEAISCFSGIAERYREQEFTLKAIAMYKKIDRLDPRNPVIAEKLANLYSIQGLVVDARAQYMVVADTYSRAGDSKKAVEVLHKIADLDPNNTDVRLKLAESYLKEGLRGESAQAFCEAGQRLLEVGAFEKSLQAYLRSLEIRPYDRPALSGLVSAHVALGTAYEAAELLERLIPDKPDEVEFIELLLQAYLAAHDAAGAERATSLLMDHDASNYTRFLEVARLYLDGGNLDDSARVLSTVTERVLAGREEAQLLELVEEVLARDPEQITALRLLVRIHWWQRDMDKLRAALERLTEAAEAAGQADDERYALTQLVRLVPDASRYAARLAALGGAQEESIDDASIPSSVSFEEVPTFSDFAIVRSESFAAVDESPVAPEPGDQFEFNSVAPETIADPSSSFADLNEELTHHEPPRESAAGFATAEPSYGEVDFGSTIPPAQTDELSQPAHQDAMLRQELESVDFYIGQGYLDIALDTLDMLEKQFELHPEIEARRQQIRELSQDSPAAIVGTAEPAVAETDETGTMQDFAALVIEAEPQVHSAPPAFQAPAPPVFDSGLADIFEEFRSAEEAEAPDADDYETHYNMGIAYKEMDLLDEAVREFQLAVAVVDGKDGTPRFLRSCNMLGHCFMQKGLPKAAVLWFKKGLAAPGSEDEHQALRYELGNAYEKIGDLEGAVDVFTEVYSIDVSYRGVGEKLKGLQARTDGGGKRHE